MERKNISKQEQMVKCFLHLPEKLLLFHGMENISEFVLHTLCSRNCLNLSKAAYFIDNHDFDCLKGIAGFDKNELYHNDDINSDTEDHNYIWQNTDHFSDHMKKCLFNQKVRNVMKPSASKASDEDIINDLARELAINKPIFYSWKVKYDNKAIFIFETAEDDIDIDSDILKGICLLGFCPIF